MLPYRRLLQSTAEVMTSCRGSTGDIATHYARNMACTRLAGKPAEPRRATEAATKAR